MSAARRTIVAGNWKMNLDRAKARELTAAVAARAADSPRDAVAPAPTQPAPATP
jgi:triosephosphate isomerase